MQYWRVEWRHDFNDEATLFFSEVGEDGYEVRKVQRYRDGTLIKADRDHETARIFLSEAPVGDLEEVNSGKDFSSTCITPGIFEEMWHKANWSQPTSSTST
ncbi:hypothetical protein OG800_19505 [Streptomyces sp. NBC_00445]|uniref:DUF6881 domain-containing protein n=1 Tax=Streptomyces sp. NBC_00445 TaxID=2975745 RepID=UPI002E1F81CB